MSIVTLNLDALRQEVHLCLTVFDGSRHVMINQGGGSVKAFSQWLKLNEYGNLVFTLLGNFIKAKCVQHTCHFILW